MLHYTVCVCVWHSNYKISLLHTLRHISWYYVQSVFHENFHVMICHAGMCSFFQTAGSRDESRWVEQPEGDCGIEAGGVEAWKEQWEPVGLGGFGVSNEKLPPEPRGGSAEFLGPDRPDPGGLKIVPGNVGMAMWRGVEGLRRSAETCLLSCHVVFTLSLYSPVHALHQEWFAPRKIVWCHWISVMFCLDEDLLFCDKFHSLSYPLADNSRSAYGVSCKFANEPKLQRWWPKLVGSPAF